MSEPVSPELGDYRDNFMMRYYRPTGVLFLPCHKWLREEFKWACAQHSRSMHQTLIDFMRTTVRGDPPDGFLVERAKGGRDSVLLLREVNQNIRDQFKAWCARRCVTMTEAIESYMKYALKEGLP